MVTGNGSTANLFRDWPHDWFGLWRFDDDNRPTNVPTLKEIVDKDWNIPDLGRIVAYLNACPVSQSAGRPESACSLCGELLGDPSSWRSDGVWSWPDRLGHLVSKHSVRVPDRMLAHIRERGYASPSTLC